MILVLQERRIPQLAKRIPFMSGVYSEFNSPSARQSPKLCMYHGWSGNKVKWSRMRGAAPDWSELAPIHRPLMSVARVIRVSRV